MQDDCLAKFKAMHHPPTCPWFCSSSQCNNIFSWKNSKNHLRTISRMIHEKETQGRNRLCLLCNIHLYRLKAWKHHFKGNGVFEKWFLLKSWYDNILNMACIHWATLINHWMSTKIIAQLQDNESSSLSVLYWFPDNMNRVAIIFTDILHTNLHRQQYAGSGTIAFLFWLHAFIVTHKWIQTG